jgi:hypothetical protein
MEDNTPLMIMGASQENAVSVMKRATIPKLVGKRTEKLILFTCK